MPSFEVKRVGVHYGNVVRPGFGTNGYVTLINEGPESVHLVNAQPGVNSVDNGSYYEISVGEKIRVADPDPEQQTAPGLVVFMESNGATVAAISEGNVNG